MTSHWHPRLQLKRPVGGTAGVASFALTLFLLLPAQALGAPKTTPGKQLDRAASCVIQGNRTGSASLAEAAPGSAIETAAWEALATRVGHCFAKVGLSDAPETRALLAGAVAQSLYLERIGGRRLLWRAPEAHLDATWKQVVLQKTENWPIAAAAAECLAYVAGTETDQLLRSRRGSSAEAAAMRFIVASLPRCMPAGSQLRASSERMRAEVARAAFRHNLPLTRPAR